MSPIKTTSYNQLDIDYLIDELTLAEKISLLAGKDFWHTVPIPRVKIPSIRVSDGPNGIRGTKFFNGVPSNCFPCGTGLAATFNKDLLVESGELMGKEAKLKGAAIILGPTCNIIRSPLGGRSFESYSEDPLLSGIAAASVIKGIQNEKVVACLKHFVCNDQEDDRRAVDTLLTDRAFREIYLKPFHIAIRDSNPKSFMTSYNKINGEHVSQSKKILQDILRKELNYTGTIMSDWYGVYSTKEALDAGLNLEMPGPTRFRQINQVLQAVQSNEVSEDVIDENVRYILRLVNESLKAEIPDDVVESPNDDPAAGELLRKVGDESIVLLKNENNILPLSKTKIEGQGKIAVIGPNVKVAQDSGGGSASMTTRYKITPWEGIQTKLEEGNNTVGLEYSLGAFLDSTLPDVGLTLFNEEGEKGLNARFYKHPPGHKGDRLLLEELKLSTSRVLLSDYSSEHLDPNKPLYYVDFTGTYIPDETAEYNFGTSCVGTAQIFVDDALVVDNKTKQTKGDAYFLGMGTREERGSVHLEKGVSYNVRVEFGTAPTYTLESGLEDAGGVYFGIQIKSTPEVEISKAVKLAKEVDTVVLVVGLSKECESEGFDRPDMDIPGSTNELIEQVVKANPNVIVVNQSGSPVTMPWAEKVPAIIQAWFGGNELGNTIADVLFGDYNPSGKLSMTFPKRLQDNPSYFNFGSSNGEVLYGEDVFVGYRYYEKIDLKPLFAFGHGLSYTSFELDELVVTNDGDSVDIKVRVTNTGKLAGAEVVQIYIEQENPLIPRPKKELKDFGKIHLEAGKSGIVELSISIKEATSYWNVSKRKWQSDKGTYKVLVGTSSDKIEVEDKFITSKTFNWVGV
ncbi:beta-glucosidase [Scheffersomyces coipomensis]|uniref:beta-glucosidase n=1 Tax=Scheffersomyces coipomensis TaxID=1788519 RepID=UPI00315DE00B